MYIYNKRGEKARIAPKSSPKPVKPIETDSMVPPKRRKAKKNTRKYIIILILLLAILFIFREPIKDKLTSYKTTKEISRTPSFGFSSGFKVY